MDDCIVFIPAKGTIGPSAIITHSKWKVTKPIKENGHTGIIKCRLRRSHRPIYNWVRSKFRNPPRFDSSVNKYIFTKSAHGPIQSISCNVLVDWRPLVEERIANIG